MKTEAVLTWDAAHLCGPADVVDGVSEHICVRDDVLRLAVAGVEGIADRFELDRLTFLRPKANQLLLFFLGATISERVLYCDDGAW